MTRCISMMMLMCACATSTSDQAYHVKKGLLDQLAGKRDWPAVQRLAPELLREHPDDAEVLMLRGVALREQGELDAAEDTLTRAIELDDGLAYAHSALGVLCDMRHQQEVAETHHYRAVDLSPDDAELLNNLGFSLLIHGKLHDAVVAFDHALQIAPSHERARNNLGFAYASMGRMRDASEQFEQAGEPAEAKNNLGFAYERRGDLAQAQKLYAEALTINPSLAEAHRNLRRVEYVSTRRAANQGEMP